MSLLRPALTFNAARRGRAEAQAAHRFVNHPATMAPPSSPRTPPRSIAALGG